MDEQENNGELACTPIDSAEGVFEHFRPKEPLNEKYIFRGQSGKYRLVPSALRDDFIEKWESMFIDDEGEKDKKEYFRNSAKKDWTENKKDTGKFQKIAKLLNINLSDIKDGNEEKIIDYLYKTVWQKYLEFRVLNRFIRLLDDAGIPFPGDDSLFRSRLNSLRMNTYTKEQLESDIYKKFEDWKYTNNIGWLHFIALAQHSELPTQLLDWSVDSWHALYFAAENAIKRFEDEEKDKNLYIYELDLAKVKSQNKNSFYYVEVPGTLNPNLAAQKGRLTWVDHKLIEEARAGYEAMPEFKNAIKCYVIPFRCSVQILEKLRKHYISRDTLFPGLYEKSQAMRKTAYWMRNKEEIEKTK